MFSCIAVWGALLLVLMLYWAVWSPALWDTLVDHGLPSECPVLGAGGLRAPHTKFLADSTQQQYLFIYCLNPNSTNNSIELNLRLDYILTQLSTHHPPPHKLSVVVVNCPS